MTSAVSRASGRLARQPMSGTATGRMPEAGAACGPIGKQENAAEKVERQVSKSAAALLLSDRIGQVFSGIVTGASDKGTWVRVFTPPVEGRVVRGQPGLDVGDHVRVQLLATDVDRGFIDFARAG